MKANLGEYWLPLGSYQSIKMLMKPVGRDGNLGVKEGQD